MAEKTSKAENRVEVVALESLTQDPSNANKGTERGLRILDDSLRELGAGRSILVDKHGVIIAGNKTHQGAADIGLKDAIVVHTDGHQLVVVQRDDLDITTAQGQRMAIADNRSSELGLDWNPEVLAELQATAPDVLAGLFTDADLKKLGIENEMPDAPEPQIDKADELREKWQTEAGQLWVIPSKTTPGKVHRLLAGDSTKAEDVARVMNGEKAGVIATDPPYAVDYVEKARDMNKRGYVHSRATLSAAIQGDGINEKDSKALWTDAFGIAATVLAEGAAWYIWHAPGRAMLDLHEVLRSLGLLYHQTIIWVKPNFVIGRCDYQWQHEPCFYGWRKGSRPAFYGPKNQTTVWEISRDISHPDHPTMKPVECFLPPMQNHLNAGEIAYDCFAGSGPAFVAAEQLGRLCYGMEIEPKYVAVCLQRLADMGLEPSLASSPSEDSHG